jgi:16S rRNA (cytidine1402-2'-O)-methyltransferase
MVIVCEGNNEEVNYNDLSIIDHVNLYIKDNMSTNDAIKLVAKERNVAKSIIYKEYHNGK